MHASRNATDHVTLCVYSIWSKLNEPVLYEYEIWHIYKEKTDSFGQKWYIYTLG